MERQKQAQEITFEEVEERGCGLDVHKKEIAASVNVTSIESETHVLVDNEIFDRTERMVIGTGICPTRLYIAQVYTISRY